MLLIEINYNIILYATSTLHFMFQVAMFAPLDLGWLKNIMSNITLEENHNINNEPYISSNDYRKSTLDTDNQYLPPN